MKASAYLFEALVARVVKIYDESVLEILNWLLLYIHMRINKHYARVFTELNALLGIEKEKDRAMNEDDQYAVKSKRPQLV